MNKTFKTLTFATVLALSLVASTTGALAKSMNGRETAWTDAEPVPAPVELFEEVVGAGTDGVTWEE